MEKEFSQGSACWSGCSGGSKKIRKEIAKTSSPQGANEIMLDVRESRSFCSMGSEHKAIVKFWIRIYNYVAEIKSELND